MSNNSIKRGVDGFVVPKRGAGVVSRNANEDRDQFCNRLGCKGRLNHTRVSHRGCSGKLKSLRPPPSNVSNGKDIVGTSSSTASMARVNRRKPLEQSQRSPRTLKSETSSSETSSSIQEDERNVPNYGKVRVTELGSSSVSNNSSYRRKVYRQKSGTGNQSTPLGSSDLFVSKITVSSLATKSSDANASRYALRNLRCNPVSDVVPSASSSSESKLAKRKDLVKKRNSEVESSSSSRGKKINGPPLQEKGFSTSSHGINISDSRQGGSIQPPRLMSGNNGRTRRLSNNRNRTTLPGVTPQSETSDVIEFSFTPNRFSVEASSSIHSASFFRPGTNSCSLANIPQVGSREPGLPNSLLNLEDLRWHNVDGIAEALLALERIEQDEELTYEQLLALDANLFLGGLGFYDQHREMRLDIDNMSYEELLALEEKMGDVSTALSEEAILKCLSSSIYQPRAFGDGSKKASKGDENEVKCSICQEEYEMGDELGRLQCEHGYHKECINDWLRLKNWCPICKSSAVGPTPSD